MLGDLHLHSRFSDGSYTVEDALIIAQKRGLDYLSITDHDTVEHTESFLRLAPQYNIRPIAGVEISAMDPATGRKVHVLGYNYRLPAENITKLCAPLLAERHATTLKQIQIVQNAGFPVSLDEVLGTAGTAPHLYKQHIMAVLIQKGLADGFYGKRYKELFGKGGLCPSDIAYVQARDAVRAIREDGGIPVLAHAGQTDSWDIVALLVDEGLQGIELYHEDHGKPEHEKVWEAAKKFNLAMTGGTDDHGAFGSHHVIGEIRAPFRARELFGF